MPSLSNSMDAEQPTPVDAPPAQGDTVAPTAAAAAAPDAEPSIKPEQPDATQTLPASAQPPAAAEPMDVDPPTNGSALVFSRLPGRPVPFTQQVAPIGPLPIPPKDCSYEERLPHRDRIRQLPFGKFFECAGRPNLVWEVADYTAVGPGVARAEIPFLFKAFETGQIGPARMKAKYGDARAHTIHEYLDWTMIAQPPTPENDLPNQSIQDFTGFRVVIVLPRFRLQWPPPGLQEEEGVREHPELGAPLNPLPQLVVGGRAVTAATIRLGPNYVEVPFVATHETRRGKGWGRACIEAIEDIARYLQLPYLLLCSTNDNATKSTWQHLGFIMSTDEDLERMQVDTEWLLHMDNTVQMHKIVQPVRRWRSIVVKHDSLRRRVYVSEEELAKAKRAYDDGSMFKRPVVPPPKKPPKKSTLPRKRKMSIVNGVITPRFSTMSSFGGASESGDGY